MNQQSAASRERRSDDRGRGRSRLLNLLAPVFVLLSLTASPALATVVLVPEDLGPGDQYRLAFVTSQITTAQLTIEQYNDFVQSYAPTLPEEITDVEWKAIASTWEVDARVNTGTDQSDNIPIYRLDGEMIASGSSDLWDGDLLNPILLDESGAEHYYQEVWTGTATDGTANTDGPVHANYLGIVSQDPYWGAVGDRTLATGSWISHDYLDYYEYTPYFPQTRLLPMYGLSSPITAPGTVPEPSSVILWTAIGAVGLVGFRLVRRKTKAANA